MLQRVKFWENISFGLQLDYELSNSLLWTAFYLYVLRLNFAYTRMQSIYIINEVNDAMQSEVCFPAFLLWLTN